jgi:hypothetical protein
LKIDFQKITASMAGIILIAGTSLSAATLTVGPGKQFKNIEAANAAAKDGDTIEVYPLPDGKAYQRTAVQVRRRGLRFIGKTGQKGKRIKISGKGYNYSGRGRVPRAIFQFNAGADGCSLEGFELTDAHNTGSYNGAGVRINRASHITIGDCEIHKNDMGIMAAGDGTSKTARNLLIENCIIHHNGNAKDPGQNHNLYLGGTSITLRFCEVYSSLTGHNVKSRAHFNRIEYCYIHDSANREFDLVDARDTAAPNSDSVLIGNIIVKARPIKGNKGVIHFGQDGGGKHNGRIYLVHNTIITPYITPVVYLSTAEGRASLINNIIWDGGARQNNQVLVGVRKGVLGKRADGSNNWLEARFSSFKVFGVIGRSRQSPPFVAPDKRDYHLRGSDKQFIDAGLSLSEIALPSTPFARSKSKLELWQYRHPAAGERRTVKNLPDLGAYESN